MGTRSKKTISIFISHQGCPNDCVFCNQRKITGIETPQSLDEIKISIDRALSTIPGEKSELAFFGGSFTAIPLRQQESLLRLAGEYRERGLIEDIRISTRPDAIDENVLRFLKLYGVTIIELGVQSTSDKVLSASNRGHNAKCIFDSSKLILKNGFKLGLQMMIGLPQDNELQMMKTVEDIISIQPHFVRIYPVLVIKDTELESLFENKLYFPLELEVAVRLAKQAYVRFREHGIKVIRIGLQATERISTGGDIVAGPFHPAFGEMVYSYLFRDVLEQYIVSTPIAQGETVNVEVPSSRISQWVGISKSNIRYFQEKYGINQNIQVGRRDLIIINDYELSIDQIFI